VAAAQVDVAQKEKEMTQEEKEAEETRFLFGSKEKCCCLKFPQKPQGVV
jgi:hypothetical protein